MKKTRGYPPHPYADVFPMRDGKPLKEMAQDIKATGQKDPINLYQGKVLDGRRRQAACLMAGVEPRYEPFKGTDQEALDLVISRHLHRRDLTKNERALAAAKLANIRDGRPRKTGAESAGFGADAGKSKRKKLARKAPVSGHSEESPSAQTTRQEAAEKMEVSPNEVKRAKTVINNGTKKLLDAVSRGRVSLTDAAEVCREDPRVQNKAVDEVLAGRSRTAAGAAKELRPVTCEAGPEVPEHLADLFRAAADYWAVHSLLISTRSRLKALAGEYGEEFHVAEAARLASDLRDHIRESAPYAPCPFCEGEDCRYCRGKGWLTQGEHDELPDRPHSEYEDD